VRRALTRFRLPYLTITPTFSICPTHGYLSGEHLVCEQCGQGCEVWTRVMGYFRPVSSFNIGKKGEYAERTFFTEAASGVCADAPEHTPAVTPCTRHPRRRRAQPTARRAQPTARSAPESLPLTCRSRVWSRCPASTGPGSWWRRCSARAARGAAPTVTTRRSWTRAHPVPCPGRSWSSCWHAATG